MGEMMGTFKKNPPCAQGVLGGQIDSEITMNSQCTPWINTPLPPVTSSSSIDTPVENLSPVPVPAPAPAPVPALIEDAGVLNHSDQENMEEDAEAEDTADMLEEEELARRFNRPVRSLSAFRDHHQVIRHQASGRVLPASKQHAHPYLLPAESIGECQVNQWRSSLGSRQDRSSRVLQPLTSC